MMDLYQVTTLMLHYMHACMCNKLDKSVIECCGELNVLSHSFSVWLKEFLYGVAMLLDWLMIRELVEKFLHANLAATENQKVKDLLNEILQMPNWSKI